MDEPQAGISVKSVAIRGQPFPGISFTPVAVAAIWDLLEDRTLPEFSDLMIAAGHCARRAIAWGVVVSLTCVLLAWNYVPATYDAVSYVQVRSRESFIFAKQGAEREETEFLRAQEKKVFEKPVLDAALTRPIVAPFIHMLPAHEPVLWMRSRMSVDLRAGAELMSVSFTHTSPEVALAFNTAITNAYVEAYLRTITNDRQRQLAELESAAKQSDHQLNEYWIQLQSLADRIQSSSAQQLTVRDQIQLQAYREYAQQLRQAQSQANQLRVQLAEAEMQLALNLPDTELAEAIDQHPELVTRREQLLQLDLQISQLMKFVARQDAPRLTDLQIQRNMLAKETKLLLEQLRPQIQKELLDSRRKAVAGRTAVIMQQIETNSDEIAFLRDMLAQLESQIERTSETNGVQLEMLRRTIERQTRLADGLWKALESRKIETQSLPRVTLLEAAQLPRNPKQREQLKATAAAGASGLLMTILGIGYLEWRSCRIRHPHEYVLRCGMKLFGMGSFYQGASAWWRPRRFQNNIMQAGISEAIACTTSADNQEQIPVVFVSSATAGEPRDVAAVELALKFQQLGLKTLLVDADAKQNRLAELVSLPRRNQKLRGDEPFANVAQQVHATSMPDLDFLSTQAIADKSDASIALAVADLLKALEGRYAAIVIHGPDILSTPDSVLIAAKCNAALFATELGLSRWNHVSAARQRMECTGIPLLGAILCGSRWRTKKATPRVAALTTPTPIAEA